MEEGSSYPSISPLPLLNRFLARVGRVAVGFLLDCPSHSVPPVLSWDSLASQTSSIQERADVLEPLEASGKSFADCLMRPTLQPTHFKADDTREVLSKKRKQS